MSVGLDLEDITQEATIDWSENSYDPNALGAGVGATDFSRNMIRFHAELRAGKSPSRGRSASCPSPWRDREHVSRSSP